MFFHASTFVGSPNSCLNMKPLGQMFKHLLRDLASVDAMKQACVIIIIMHILPDFYQNHAKNSANTLKYPYSCNAWVKVFRIIPEFRILRLTFHRKSASKS